MVVAIARPHAKTVIARPPPVIRGHERDGSLPASKPRWRPARAQRESLCAIRCQQSSDRRQRGQGGWESAHHRILTSKGRNSSRLRIVPLCGAGTTAVCRGAVIIAGLPPQPVANAVRALKAERGNNDEATAHRFSPSLSLDGRTCPNSNPQEATGSSKAERTDGLQACGNGQRRQVVDRRLHCCLRTAWCCAGRNALSARACF